jgi:DNA polymerase I-like protein with 3'-5' exonuclease and polymerase domains
MGVYAGSDVLMNRSLNSWLDQRRPSELSEIMANEIEGTQVLFQMERAGMRVNPKQIKFERFRSLEKLIDLHSRLAELTEEEYVDSNVHLHKILIGDFNLPVVEWTEKGSPSFNKEALKKYTIHPVTLANPVAAEIIDLIIEERAESHFKSLFLDSFDTLMDQDGLLHPQYNQLVRTGRTSCGKPNAQQFSKRAKKLIIPGEGEGIIAADASQLEFRLLITYINDHDAIAKYAEDPDTDFHQYVADQAGVSRSAGKTLNFAMSYGAGKTRTVEQLVGDPSVMADVGQAVNDLIEQGKIKPEARSRAYRHMCEELGARIYTDHHARFPGIKRISKFSANRVKLRAQSSGNKIGWVANIYGGRRHLPAKNAHRAFNTVVQGGAMQYVKEVMRRMHVAKITRELNLTLCACVHDCLVWRGPEEIVQDPRTLKLIKAELEKPPSVALKVPMRWDVGASTENWAAAG